MFCPRCGVLLNPADIPWRPAADAQTPEEPPDSRNPFAPNPQKPGFLAFEEEDREPAPGGVYALVGKSEFVKHSLFAGIHLSWIAVFLWFELIGPAALEREPAALLAALGRGVALLLPLVGIALAQRLKREKRANLQQLGMALLRFHSSILIACLILALLFGLTNGYGGHMPMIALVLPALAIYIPLHKFTKGLFWGNSDYVDSAYYGEGRPSAFSQYAEITGPEYFKYFWLTLLPVGGFFIAQRESRRHGKAVMRSFADAMCWVNLISWASWWGVVLFTLAVILLRRH